MKPAPGLMAARSWRGVLLLAAACCGCQAAGAQDGLADAQSWQLAYSAPAPDPLAGLSAWAAGTPASADGDRPAAQAGPLMPEVPGADSATAVRQEQVIESGRASWYGKRFHGRRTASGERFDMRAFTAAHPSLAFGTVIRVRNPETGKEVEVRVNDRGPHVHGRIIDISRAAAQALDLLDSGHAVVVLLRP